MRNYRLLLIVGACFTLLILGSMTSNTSAQPPAFKPPTHTPIPTNAPPTNTPGGSPTNTPVPVPSSTPVVGAGGIQLTLNSGWSLQSSSMVAQTGAVISTTGFVPQGWYPITAPASVIAGLLQNNVYPDPYFGTNFQLINAANFSVPWWYRNAFTLPASENGKRVWLKFEGLNYRASVWLNGVQLSDGNTTVGPFRTFEFDVTANINYTGTNVL